MHIEPIEELVKLGSIERVLRVPFVLNELRSVDEAKDGDGATDQGRMLSQGAFTLQYAVILIDGKVAGFRLSLQHLKVGDIRHVHINHVDKTADSCGFDCCIELSIS